MQYSVCSYSFHRTFDAGEMDIFGYTDWCREYGFTQLDPWMKHLEAGYEDDAYLDRVRKAANDAGLPFGCVAVDGAHIYEPTAEARDENRLRAYRWIDIAGRLGATQVRIDAGGRDESLDEIWDIVIEGYNDLIPRARAKGIEVLIENHWGPTKDPDAMHQLLDAVDGLGLLFDSANWPEGTHDRAWVMYPPYARLTHVKAFAFDGNGNETNWDLPLFINLLREDGYQGCWGIEGESKDGNEHVIVLQTLAMIKRVLEEAAYSA